MSQTDLAALLGVNVKSVSDYERGRIVVNPYRLLELARRFGLSLESFLDPAYRPGPPNPRTKADWILLFPGDNPRADLHFDIDQKFARHSG
jgi:transcriptional regulator with XRE-family HTH domain